MEFQSHLTIKINSSWNPCTKDLRLYSITLLPSDYYSYYEKGEMLGKIQLKFYWKVILYSLKIVCNEEVNAFRIMWNGSVYNSCIGSPCAFAYT